MTDPVGVALVVTAILTVLLGMMAWLFAVRPQHPDHKFQIYGGDDGRQ
jgi:hypothetical protein